MHQGYSYSRRERATALDPESRRAFLRRLHAAVRGDCSQVVAGERIGTGLGLSREATFRIIESLSREGGVLYAGAGPRIALTPTGREWVEADTPLPLGGAS